MKVKTEKTPFITRADKFLREIAELNKQPTVDFDYIWDISEITPRDLLTSVARTILYKKIQSIAGKEIILDIKMGEITVSNGYAISGSGEYSVIFSDSSKKCGNYSFKAKILKKKQNSLLSFEKFVLS